MQFVTVIKLLTKIIILQKYHQYLLITFKLQLKKYSIRVYEYVIFIEYDNFYQQEPNINYLNI